MGELETVERQVLRVLPVVVILVLLLLILAAMAADHRQLQHELGPDAAHPSGDVLTAVRVVLP